jgi:D-alanyl-lipoteichoic acid acyltransferase DltB (MBOAT superfamily)
MDPWINYAAGYVAIFILYLRFERNAKRRPYVIALLNTLFTFLCFFQNSDGFQWEAFVVCFAFVLLFYYVLRFYRKYSAMFYFFIAILVPLSSLVVMKMGYIFSIAGFSYLVFRLIYLVYEAYLGRIRFPSFANYVGFAFFPLTFLVGPINPYSNYEHFLDHPDRKVAPLPRALGRILVGIIKCYIIASLFSTLTFATFWDTGHYHGITDFIVSCIATTFYIYFNFSGICDMVIGAAGLLNIKVSENFNNPFLARNLADFWTRNHMTLTHLLREMLFTPGMLVLTRVLGPNHGLFSASVMTLLTFLVIGLWHGVNTGFVLFGLAHGLGIVVVMLYSSAWDKMPASFRRFTETPVMRLASVALTFSYVCLTSVFFGHDLGKLQDIIERLAL